MLSELLRKLKNVSVTPFQAYHNETRVKEQPHTIVVLFSVCLRFYFWGVGLSYMEDVLHFLLGHEMTIDLL